MNDKTGQNGGGFKVSRREFTSAALVTTGSALAATGLTSSAQADEKGSAENSELSSRLNMPSAEDRMNILDLFARYTWAYDCSDVEEMAQTFTEDGIMEAFGAEVARGRTAIKKFVSELYSERGDWDWQHYNDQHRFIGDGDECTVYSYWGIMKGNREKMEHGILTFGYYATDCIKKNGLWYIKKRSINRWDRNKLPWK